MSFQVAAGDLKNKSVISRRAYKKTTFRVNSVLNRPDMNLKSKARYNFLMDRGTAAIPRHCRDITLGKTFPAEGSASLHKLKGLCLLSARPH
jgi:hypothetical protein